MILVKEMMNRSIITVTTEVGVKKICQLLTKHKITGTPVVNKKKELLGFVSERDIIAAAGKQNFYKKTAKHVMSKNLTTIEESASLDEASLIFSTHPFRHLPVLKNNKLVGIITRNDIVSQMLGNYY
ncbi:MAG: CBS domain-containing protein [Pseudomonadota bacterium]